MALDQTLSEANFRRSVKKFFVDNLYTVDGVYLDFNRIYQTPKNNAGDDLDEWVRFHFNGVSTQHTISTGRVAAYLFTRRDPEGSNLALLRDKLQNYLVDLTMPDGLRRVPLYNDSWVIIGGMIVTTGNESTEEFAQDGSMYKFVNLYFKYAVT